LRARHATCCDVCVGTQDVQFHAIDDAAIGTMISMHNTSSTVDRSIDVRDLISVPGSDLKQQHGYATVSGYWFRMLSQSHVCVVDVESTFVCVHCFFDVWWVHVLAVVVKVLLLRLEMMRLESVAMTMMMTH
jgi:hypothetical protein